MRPKRRGLNVAIFASILIGMIAWFAWPKGDVTVHGRRLSAWLRILGADPRNNLTIEDLAKQDGDDAVARAAIAKLDSRALPFLVDWMSYGERKHSVQDCARWLVENISALRSSAWLSNQAYSDTLHSRLKGAGRAFEILGPKAAFVIPDLAVLAASTTNWSTADAAVAALGQIGPEALPALMGVSATNRHDTVRWRAIDCMGRFGYQSAMAVPVLVQCLKETNVYIVTAAAGALGKIKVNCGAAIPTLIDCLLATNRFQPIVGVDEAERRLRYTVAWVIGELGAEGRAAVPVLIRALQAENEDDSMACTLMNSAGAVVDQPAVILPVLIEYLHGTNMLRRHCSARTLAKLGARAEAALPALTNALQYEDTRKMVTKAILLITRDQAELRSISRDAAPGLPAH